MKKKGLTVPYHLKGLKGLILGQILDLYVHIIQLTKKFLPVGKTCTFNHNLTCEGFLTFISCFTLVSKHLEWVEQQAVPRKFHSTWMNAHRYGQLVTSVTFVTNCSKLNYCSENYLYDYYTEENSNLTVFPPETFGNNIFRLGDDLQSQ